MNVRLNALIGTALFALSVPLHAGPRASTAYSVATDTTDGGGERATSAAYTNEGSAGGIMGVSTVAAPAETAKHGYIGQLYDVTGLTLTSASPTVNETATVPARCMAVARRYHFPRRRRH